MHIRESGTEDLAAIRGVHEDAFGDPEGPLIAQLASELLNDETARPLLSLLAEDNGRIVGHVIFSSVKVEGSPHLKVYILAPLAVLKIYQRQGIGTQLIRHGLAMLRQRDADIVLVYGDPNYYRRTGFAAGHAIEAPYPLRYPDAWMALELKAGALAEARGVARCAPALSAPEHW